jgi:hypothetical protein
MKRDLEFPDRTPESRVGLDMTHLTDTQIDSRFAALVKLYHEERKAHEDTVTWDGEVPYPTLQTPEYNRQRNALIVEIGETAYYLAGDRYDQEVEQAADAYFDAQHEEHYR